MGYTAIDRDDADISTGGTRRREVGYHYHGRGVREKIEICQ